ncbi:MAG: LLM class flavin-dependent oxidoreductase, partial [Thaumarchaeota archaeon]|nr:LLM class flavin-dependent oxidoreductase [Nitrososphaerota archaeon]
CYVSALTHRVKLGTAVIALPLRNPLVLGRQLITLQSLSGNRVIAGIAPGDYPSEFRALDVPYSERGKITDEYIDALRLISNGGKVSYHGKYLNFDEAYFYPKIASGTANTTVCGGNDQT